jgi:recombination protein RecR
MNFSPLIQKLIHALRCLPGVGPKSAQRMVFHLLERDRDGAKQLATVLFDAIQQVQHCGICRMLSETPVCGLCANLARDRALLCLVASPADVLAIEHTGGFKGLYFVLMGHLSPIDGIGPEEIGIEALKTRLEDEEVQEVIIATHSTVEGEATAYYVAELIKSLNIRVTRIAQGVPMGGNWDYIDGGTLTKALLARFAM